MRTGRETIACCEPPRFYSAYVIGRPATLVFTYTLGLIAAVKVSNVPAGPPLGSFRKDVACLGSTTMSIATVPEVRVLREVHAKALRSATVLLRARGA